MGEKRKLPPKFAAESCDEDESEDPVFEPPRLLTSPQKSLSGKSPGKPGKPATSAKSPGKSATSAKSPGKSGASEGGSPSKRAKYDSDRPNGWCPDMYPDVKHRTLKYELAKRSPIGEWDECGFVKKRATKDLRDHVIKHHPQELAKILGRLKRMWKQKRLPRVDLQVTSEKTSRCVYNPEDDEVMLVHPSKPAGIKWTVVTKNNEKKTLTSLENMARMLLEDEEEEDSEDLDVEDDSGDYVGSDLSEDDLDAPPPLPPAAAKKKSKPLKSLPLKSLPLKSLPLKSLPPKIKGKKQQSHVGESSSEDDEDSRRQVELQLMSRRRRSSEIKSTLGRAFGGKKKLVPKPPSPSPPPQFPVAAAKNQVYGGEDSDDDEEDKPALVGEPKLDEPSSELPSGGALASEDELDDNDSGYQY